MASNYTSNYKLCQWQASDKVLRTEFNADNAKIDAALAAKASASALNSLKTTVNGKASQSALDSLSSTVSGHTSTLAKKGNCIIHITSYTGDGSYGSAASAKKLTFPGKPYAVLIGGGSGFMVLVQGVSATVCASSANYVNTVSWTGNSVSWNHSGSGNAGGMLNASGTTYHVVALLKAD